MSPWRALSAPLNPDLWDPPFTPAMIASGPRTVVPSDLEPDELSLLSRALPSVEPVVLGARITAVVWSCRFPRDPATALIATDTYLALHLTWDAWVRSDRDGYRRAVELSRRQGKPGAAVLQKVSTSVMKVLTGKTGPGFLQAQVSPRFCEPPDGLRADRHKRWASAWENLPPRLPRHKGRASVAGSFGVVASRSTRRRRLLNVAHRRLTRHRPHLPTLRSPAPPGRCS